MPIYRDAASGRWLFDFDRRVGGRRLRRQQLLPAGWTRAQADAFDRQESAALYAIATGLVKPRHYIDAAVAHYLADRAPALKHGANVARELEGMRDWWTGRALEALPEGLAVVAAAVVDDRLGERGGGDLARDESEVDPVVLQQQIGRAHV